MPMKFCLTCRKLTNNGSRCPECERDFLADQSGRRGTTKQRGLGGTHRRRAEKVVAAAQVCARCGQPPTPTNPLTAHHTQARAKGGDETTPLVALCRRCNSQVGKNTP